MHLVAMPQQRDLMGLEIVSDHVIALGFAQMCAWGSDHRYVPGLARLQAGIHEVVLRKWAYNKNVCMGVWQSVIESGNTKSRSPELRLPSPVRRQPEKARGTAA